MTVALAAGAGIVAERRWRERAARAARAAMVAALYTLLPFVTFFNLARLELNADVGIGIVLGYVALAISTGLALLTARRLHLSQPRTGAVLNSTLIANTGYLGYPLCAAFLGFDSLGQAVAYDVLVAGPLLFLGAFGVGAAYGERAGQGPRERLRAFFTRNPPLLAAIAALLAPDTLAPDALLDASRAAVIALLPLGFFVVGATVAEESDEGFLHAGARLRAPLAASAVLRLAVAPGLLYLIALPLIDLPDPYLLLAAMPCGINTLLVSHVYGLDTRLAAGAVALTTAIAVAVAVGAAAIGL